jgi:rhodanese-related sulfurtransferase
MSIALLIFLAMMAYHIYIRYVPICLIPELTLQQLRKMNDGKITVVDLRDYNDSKLELVDNAVHVPVAYLKRSYRQLHDEEVIVIASDCITKNIGIRTLKRYGFKVRGAYIDGAGKFSKDGIKVRNNRVCCRKMA